MKIGIITLVSDNYGNKYQNYAVEQLLSQYGEVETFGLENLYHSQSLNQSSQLSKLNIKYIRDVLIYRMMYGYDINRVDRGVLRNLLYSKMNSEALLALKKKRSERFKIFAKENLHISEVKRNRENTGSEWSKHYDYFICGSDQIWNPSYATSSELAFCSFAPEKTICLSPSFGVSKIPKQREEEYSEWLKKIYSLSVRESAGQKIIEDLSGRKAELLLDPTMAIPVKKWNALCKKPENALPKQYIACYFLGKIDKTYIRKIQKYAAEKKLPVVMLFDITTPEYYTYDPAEVLYVIKNAEYVLTDSFHGSVFSILFHKNFFVFNRNEGGASMNSRLDTLLGKFKLEDRNSGYDRKISSEQWDIVEQVLAEERKKTVDYLSSAIREVR